jgi:hypothetical protein
MYSTASDLISLEQITRRGVLRGTVIGLAGFSLVGTASARGDRLSEELNVVRAATRKYRNVDLARKDGYGTLVSPYAPNMGFHFVNPAYVAPNEQGPFDLETPPILVYFPTGGYRQEIREALSENPGPFIHDPARDDELRLGAVEFAHGGDDGPPGTPANIFSDEDARRNLKISEEEGWEFVPGPDITALHVWVHRGNPAGVFHPTNPTLA